MIYLTIETGITYNKIEFNPRLYYLEDEDLLVLAEWDYAEDKMIFYGNSMKQFYKTDDEYYQMCIDKINHEVLHSVIQHCLNEAFNDHWPFLNGMDDSYVQDMNSSLQS